MSRVDMAGSRWVWGRNGLGSIWVAPYLVLVDFVLLRMRMRTCAHVYKSLICSEMHLMGCENAHSVCKHLRDP